MKNIKLEITQKYISGIIKGYSNSLILLGRAGLSKTEIVLKTIKEANLKEYEHFLYLTNYSTPLQFFKILQKVNELESPKLLILDDYEFSLKNLQLVGLLRSALWQGVNGQRKVCWYSTSSKVKDQEFIFDGRIILILNKFNGENPILRALADRGFFYEFNLTNREILEMLKERTKEPYKKLSLKQRFDIFNFIAKNTLGSKYLSLRTLEKGYNLFLLSPNHYQQLLLKQIR